MKIKLSDNSAYRRMRLLLAVAAMAILLAACASMGRPDGGPRDTYPPVFVKSTPVPGSINISGKKIELTFDENVQLDDPSNKVVISPAQKNNPSISANGRHITIELRDTLIPNTTYTIDFTDAIKDLNEGNVLDGFAVDFSTGDAIDSLRISGMVFEAATLEPAQGMLVGAYLERGDTAITTTPFDRITKTNQNGQFTLRNLKAGSYRVYAIKDNNRDLHWDRSEDIAFLDAPITPWAERVVVNDTIWRENGDIDSIVSLEATAYRPNDVILTWFNENYMAQYLREYNRPENRRLEFKLGAPTDTLPSFRMLNGSRAGQGIDQWAVLTTRATLDSIVYWIKDSTVIMQDSILLEARYQRLDTLERLVWTTDTLKMNIRGAKKVDNKKKKKKEDDDEATDSVAPIPMIEINFMSGNTVDLNAPLRLGISTPIRSFDPNAINLLMEVDSAWVRQPRPAFSIADTLNPMIITADYQWQPDAHYKLTVDSASMIDIYGLYNKPLENMFSTRAESEYSSVFFNIADLSQPAVVELLSGSDSPIATAPVVDGAAAFEYIMPGTYYARLYIDSNSNGKWDTGNLLDSLQPEEVYYYPRPLVLKRNWDVEQTWSIYATALDLQKPVAIKKNKPARKPGEQLPAETAIDEEEELDPTAPGYNPFDPNSRNRRNRY